MGLKLLSTGVPGLDEVLGGGLPEYSFNLIAGAPGAGKTTLAHQIVFANATAERPALYFTVLGEPPLKMLRYQQQLDFFDPEKVGDGHPLRRPEPGGARRATSSAVLDSIVQQVERDEPGHRGRRLVPHRGARRVRAAAASWSCRASCSGSRCTSPAGRSTSFLVGEYVETRDAGQPRLHRRRRDLWLHAEQGAQLHRPQARGDEDARPGADARACTPSASARRRTAGLPAHHVPARRAPRSFAPAAPRRHRRRRARRDARAAACPRATRRSWRARPARARRS